MRDKLEAQLDRFLEIERLVQDPDVLSDGARYSALAKERGSLAKVAMKYREFKELNEQIAETRRMAEEEADAEMREMALEELPGLNERREQSWNELLDLTSGGEEANRTRCMLEIRGGTGGDEAALFARDLYEMYMKYAIRYGWKTEILDASPTELGGFKEIIVGLEGEGCFRQMQYESGGHRVQRVPETETKGRIQTSMATVAVLPEPEDVEIELKPDDYRVDKFCASGPGGQHVNKTASAIRLTHFATNTVVQCQDEKSQHKNLAKALRVLKNRLYDLKQAEVHQKRADERKTLVGSGDRNERIRTYNFPENRVTDHRINVTLYKLDQILAGNCDLIVNELIEYDRQQYRAAIGVLD